MIILEHIYFAYPAYDYVIVSGVSSHSITSETSGDYAVPPDDDVSIQNDSSGDSEPEQKMLKYTTENLSKVEIIFLHY